MTKLIQTEPFALELHIISLRFPSHQLPSSIQIHFNLNSSTHHNKTLSLLIKSSEVLIDELIYFTNVRRSKPKLQINCKESFPNQSNDISNTETIVINGQLSKMHNILIDEIIMFKNNCELKLQYTIKPNTVDLTILATNHNNNLHNITEDTHSFPSSSFLSQDGTNSSTLSKLNASNQVFLDFESQRLSNDLDEKKSVCESFFIVGIPVLKGRMISESESYPSSCRHKVCSLFHAYTPEIIFNYSKKVNTKFEVTSSTALLCFPYGIKCCFRQEESNIPSIQNYVTVSTNGDGKRHYIYTMFFYQKIDYVDFKKKYDVDPIKDQLIKNRIVGLIETKDLNEECDKAIEKEIEEKMLLCEELINNDYIYLPTCLCLVTKLPYDNQIKACLSSLMKMISIGSPPKEIEQLILHLIYEIPRPLANTQVSFFIPFNASSITIKGKVDKNLPIQLGNVDMLYDYFSINLIVKIFTLLLNEQKILFICNDYSKLSLISNAFISLLYPLQWHFTYIPILAISMIKYLQSFIPFIMGMDENMLRMSHEYFSTNDESAIFIVFIKEKKKSEIVTSMKYAAENIRRQSINSNNIGGNTDAIIDIPEDLQENLIEELSLIRGKNGIDRNKQTRKLFVFLLAKLIGNYSKYVSFVDHCALFNNESFLQDKRSNDQLFFKFFINTGLFRQFIQEKKTYAYFNKIVNRIITPTTSKHRNMHIIPLKKKNSFKQFFNSSNEVPKLLFIHKNSSSNLTQDSNQKCLCNSSHKILSKSPLPNTSRGNESNDNLSLTNHLIIPPYFIQFIHLGILDLSKIQEILNKKYQGSDTYSLFQTRFISTINIAISTDNELIINRYQLPNQRHLRLSWKRKQLTRRMSTINDESIIKIQEAMKSILSCDPIIPDFDTNLLSLKNNRRTFIDILYQDKFKDKGLHILNENSFGRLSKIIFSALLVTSFDYNQVKLITQSLFYYCKLAKDNKRHCYMYEEFANKKPFGIWLNMNFWENWFFTEAIENSNGNNNDNIGETNDVYFMKLMEIVAVMNDLNISLKFQLMVLIEKIGVKFILGQDAKEYLMILEKTIIKQFNNNCHKELK